MFFFLIVYGVCIPLTSCYRIAMDDIILYDYWRSSAAYRVRIALNLKNIAYESVSIDLAGGEQKSPDYVAKNPQGLVPMLRIDGHDLTQSMAIIEYLDARNGGHNFYPENLIERAHALANAMIIASDIHPVNNLRILKYLRGELGQSDEAVNIWYVKWIAEGFMTLESHAPEGGFFGGDKPNIVDICLIPQTYNARRFDMNLDDFPKLMRIDAACNSLNAFAKAIPENVKL